MSRNKKILWGISGFLFISALAYLSESILSSVMMLCAAILCNPFALEKLESIGKRPKNKILIPIIIIFVFIGFMALPTEIEDNTDKVATVKPTETPKTVKEKETKEETKDKTKDKTKENTELAEVKEDSQTDDKKETQVKKEEDSKKTSPEANENNTMKYAGVTYKIIEVDGGDLSGSRQAKVAVDIGYGDRVYWAFTNKYGQLVKVIADKIILQDDATEPVNSKGRYYNDEAKVPGTEQSDLDEGHVIADSLGGVSNAYNITPQNSTLNRHGDQAYMEKVIRDAGGCENFVATISYSNTKIQIPSHYHFEYDLMGEHIVDDFDNVNSDEENKKISNSTSNKKDIPKTSNSTSDSTSNNEDLSKVDADGNGKVTIKEAKSAGFKMPITSNHWLYKYMDDRDGDGMVGE